MIDYSIVCKELLEEDAFLIYILDASPGDLPGLLEFRKQCLSAGDVEEFVSNRRKAAVQDVHLWLNRVCHTYTDLCRLLGNYATSLKTKISASERVLSKVMLSMNYTDVATTFPFVLVGIPKEGEFVVVDENRYTHCFVGCYLRRGPIAKTAVQAAAALGFKQSHWLEDVELWQPKEDGSRQFVARDVSGSHKILLTVPVGQKC